MGEELSQLEKRAVLGRIAAGVGRSLAKIPGQTVELGKRLINPIKGFRTGSAHLSPAKAIAAGGERGTKLTDAIAKTESGGAIRRAFGAGTHLKAPSQTLREAAGSGGVRGVAEELSRRGWTGGSAAGKYLPVGDKGQLATVWPALSVPLVRSGMSTPEEEIGSNLGFFGGGMLTAGLGLPGVAATLAAGHYGGELGKKVRAARGAGAAIPQSEQA